MHGQFRASRNTVGVPHPYIGDYYNRSVFDARTGRGFEAASVDVRVRIGERSTSLEVVQSMPADLRSWAGARGARAQADRWINYEHAETPATMVMRRYGEGGAVLPSSTWYLRAAPLVPTN